MVALRVMHVHPDAGIPPAAKLLCMIDMSPIKEWEAAVVHTLSEETSFKERVCQADGSN
jgi:hypothetical protein